MSMIKYMIYFVISSIAVVLFYNMSYGTLFAFGDKMSDSGAPNNIIEHSQTGFSVAIFIILIGLLLFLVLASTKEEYETTGLR